MAVEFPFLAGAMFKWTSIEELSAVKGRVFLLVECGHEDEALEMRRQLMKEPKLLGELIDMMRPWPTDMIKVDNDELNSHTSVKDIFPCEPDE